MMVAVAAAVNGARDDNAMTPNSGEQLFRRELLQKKSRAQKSPA
jgi:hypothetical protein